MHVAVLVVRDHGRVATQSGEDGRLFGAALPARPLERRCGRGGLSPAQSIEIIEDTGRVVQACR